MTSPGSAIDLSGRVAIVTGGAGGLGRAYCTALAARGAAVLVNDLGGSTDGRGRSPLLAEGVAEEIRKGGGRALANADTVATASGGQAICDAAIDAFGRIDIVIANAGNQRNARFADMTGTDFDAVIDVHLKGCFHTVQPAYRHMCDQGYGRIILTSSQSGVWGNPYRANYGAAKMGVLGLMHVIAQETPPGIRINAVMPNASGSRMGSPSGERVDADFITEILSRGSRFADRTSPDYVAALVTWLASEQCVTTRDCYTVLRGHYARLEMSVADGWSAPGRDVPTPEAIARKLGAVPRLLGAPRRGIDEVDLVLTRLEADLGAANEPE